MGQASWPKSSHKGIGVYTPTIRRAEVDELLRTRNEKGKYWRSRRKSRCWNMSKNLCLIDWLILFFTRPWVYIYTLLKELQPDMTRIRIPYLHRIHIQNDLNNWGKHKPILPRQAETPPQINWRLPSLPSTSLADSPSTTINTGHKHKHITIHGLSHIQLSSRRQSPSSATLLQTSNHYSILPIHTLPILDTCPKTVSTHAPQFWSMKSLMLQNSLQQWCLPAINSPNLVTDNLNLNNPDLILPQIPRNPQPPKRTSPLQPPIVNVTITESCWWTDQDALYSDVSYPPQRISPLYPPIGNITVARRCRWTDQEISHSKNISELLNISFFSLFFFYLQNH